MNRDFLGDYLDHFKGGVIRLLSQEVRDQLQGVPLPTDPDEWPARDMRLYEQLIGIPEGRVRWTVNGVHRFPRSGEARESYIDAIGQIDARYLFLDPDTGIKFSEGDSRIHITLDELKRLIAGRPDRGLMVYQHAGRRVKDSELTTNLPEWLEKYTRFTFERLAGAGLTVATYPAAQASVFFVAADPAPVLALADPVNSALGGRRIYGL